MTQLMPVSTTTLPAAAEWDTILQMSDVLVKSGFLPPSIKTPQQCAMIVLKGRELAIPPIQSLSHIHVIKGKPACSAELILGLLGRAGVTWEWLSDGSNGVAEIRYQRPGFKPCVGRFTAEDAQQAHLAEGNPTWKNYPANMLRARAITNGARMIGPDIIMGMSYTPEELGALTNEDGELIEEAPPRPTRPQPAAPKPIEPPAPKPPPKSYVADPIYAEADELADEEAKSAIARILELEARYDFKAPQHKANKRIKYAGAEELDQASLDGLCAYLEVLEAHAPKMEG